MSPCKVFVKIKILFRIRIRIRIMILLWISIPDPHFIHGRHQILFGSANSFKSYFVHMKSLRTYIHPDRQTEIFFGLFCLLRHKNHKHLSKGENFFFFSLMRLQYFLFLHTLTSYIYVWQFTRGPEYLDLSWAKVRVNKLYVSIIGQQTLYIQL